MSCIGCRDVATLAPFSMAFQPIVDVAAGSVFAYEALVRGPVGEGARTILDVINEGNRYAFDQQCRVKAIELAVRLGLAQGNALLSINFLPNAVYEPRACIRLTLDTAARFSLPLDRLMFEFTENEAIDGAHVQAIVAEYKSIGFKVALDDFGAGHAGLGLLTKIRPDIVKLDMDLVRGIDVDPTRRVIVRNTVRMLRELDILPICEGLETPGELAAVRDLGVSHVQGYLIARPGFEALPPVDLAVQ